jgi:hypothetical protein
VGRRVRRDFYVVGNPGGHGGAWDRLSGYSLVRCQEGRTNGIRSPFEDDTSSCMHSMTRHGAWRSVNNTVRDGTDMKFISDILLEIPL